MNEDFPDVSWRTFRWVSLPVEKSMENWTCFFYTNQTLHILRSQLYDATNSVSFLIHWFTDPACDRSRKEMSMILVLVDWRTQAQPKLKAFWLRHIIFQSCINLTNINWNAPFTEQGSYSQEHTSQEMTKTKDKHLILGSEHKFGADSLLEIPIQHSDTASVSGKQVPAARMPRRIQANHFRSKRGKISYQIRIKSLLRAHTHTVWHACNMYHIFSQNTNQFQIPFVDWQL